MLRYLQVHRRRIHFFDSSMNMKWHYCCLIQHRVFVYFIVPVETLSLSLISK